MYVKTIDIKRVILEQGEKLMEQNLKPLNKFKYL